MKSNLNLIQLAFPQKRNWSGCPTTYWWTWACWSINSFTLSSFVR